MGPSQIGPVASYMPAPGQPPPPEWPPRPIRNIDPRFELAA